MMIKYIFIYVLSVFLLSSASQIGVQKTKKASLRGLEWLRAKTISNHGRVISEALPTIASVGPCVYSYSCNNVVFYIGQAANCHTRIDQHNKKQFAVCSVADPLKLAALACEAFGDPACHDYCIMKHCWGTNLELHYAPVLLANLDNTESWLIGQFGTNDGAHCNRNAGAGGAPADGRVGGPGGVLSAGVTAIPGGC